jgi:hypothetical protein
MVLSGAPPGTRTPNPRIESPNPVMSSWFGACRLVPFPQASDEPLCRPVSAQAGYLPGRRAPMEHRYWHLVLDRQTGWGSGGTVEAADFWAKVHPLAVRLPATLRAWRGRALSYSGRARPLVLDTDMDS